MNSHDADLHGRTLINNHRLVLFACLVLVSTVANGQWQRVNVPTTSSLRGLSVVSEEIVWASGTGGTVIKTIDGGKNWSVMVVPGAEKLDFRGVRAFDGNTAVIISSGPAEKGQAHIYRTIDGGKNWTRVFEEHRPGIFFDAIAFWDRDHGIVLSDPVEGKFALFITADSGVTWRQLSPTALPPALPYEGAFAASNSCLTVQGSKDVWFATGGAKVARIFRSSDRGAMWQVTETPMHPANASSGIFSLQFRDARNGVAVGGDYAHPESSDLPNVLLTADGGKTWQVGDATDPKGLYLSAVAILTGEPHKSVSVGIKGMFIPAAISGNAWTRVADEELNAVAIASGTTLHIWAVGPKGSVLHKEMWILNKN